MSKHVAYELIYRSCVVSVVAGIEELVPLEATSPNDRDSENLTSCAHHDSWLTGHEHADKSTFRRHAAPLNQCGFRIRQMQEQTCCDDSIELAICEVKCLSISDFEASTWIPTIGHAFLSANVRLKIGVEGVAHEVEVLTRACANLKHRGILCARFCTAFQGLMGARLSLADDPGAKHVAIVR